MGEQPKKAKSAKILYFYLKILFFFENNQNVCIRAPNMTFVITLFRFFAEVRQIVLVF